MADKDSGRIWDRGGVGRGIRWTGYRGRRRYEVSEEREDTALIDRRSEESHVLLKRFLDCIMRLLDIWKYVQGGQQVYFFRVFRVALSP